MNSVFGYKIIKYLYFCLELLSIFMEQRITMLLFPE
jgi:hypothetical protein